MKVWLTSECCTCMIRSIQASEWFLLLICTLIFPYTTVWPSSIGQYWWHFNWKTNRAIVRWLWLITTHSGWLLITREDDQPIKSQANPCVGHQARESPTNQSDLKQKHVAGGRWETWFGFYCSLVDKLLTSDRKSKRAWSDCVPRIPFILRGSPNECWLHTCREHA